MAQALPPLCQLLLTNASLPLLSAADEEAVRNCQAYLLFYSQRRLLEQR